MATEDFSATSGLTTILRHARETVQRLALDAEPLCTRLVSDLGLREKMVPLG